MQTVQPGSWREPLSLGDGRAPRVRPQQIPGPTGSPALLALPLPLPGAVVPPQNPSKLPPTKLLPQDLCAAAEGQEALRLSGFYSSHYLV